MKRVATEIFLWLIRLYRAAISPLLGPTCRYTPSCSAYTEEAIGRFGPWRGGWMGLRRVARCHPWRAGGYDPVPALDENPGAASPRSDSPSTPTDVLRSVSRT